MNQRTQVGLIRELFDPATAKRIEEGGLTVFHRHQCLFILREAARCSPDLPELVLTPEISRRIGLLALMANEHGSSPSQASTDFTTRSPHYGVHIDFFGQSRLASEHQDTFVRLLSKTPEELRARLASRPWMIRDFTV